MQRLLFIFVIVLFVFLLPHDVYAGVCPFGPPLTNQYTSYLLYATGITISLWYFSLLIINSFIFYTKLRFFSIFIHIKLFLFFSFLLTTGTILLHGLFYFASTPFAQAHIPDPLTHFITYQTFSSFLTFYLLSPLGWILLIAHWSLIQALLRYSIHTNNIKLVITFFLFTLPHLGLLWEYFLTDMYFHVFPFFGDKYLPCI